MGSETHSKSAIVSFDHVTVRVRDRFILQDTNWSINKGDHWAVIGPNGSGKSSLVRCLVDQYPVCRGLISSSLKSPLRDHISLVSFERHRQIIGDDAEQDASRLYSGNIDTTLKGRDLLGPDVAEGLTSPSEQILSILDIENLLETPVRGLSTGEMRRILIASAVRKNPAILVLDEPFDGLDIDSRPVLMEAVDKLAGTDMTLIIVTHRYEEIVPSITHVLCLKDQNVYLQGMKRRVLSSQKFVDLYSGRPSLALESWGQGDKDRTLIDMREVHAQYGKKTIFKNVHWRVMSGENWQVLGPNGCGKSTLLALITGDNPQTYSNEIYLFGTRRGRGDSIWDVKKRIGIVSSALQIRYRKPIKSMDVILSGFYESVGMYKRPSQEERETAERWIQNLNIGELAKRRFDWLSFGEQRLVLIARAMIKKPDLLLLDEPCQGLDPGNRTAVLDALNTVGQRTNTSLIFVTHHRDEVVPALTHRLTFIRSADGCYTTDTEVIPT